MHSTESEQQEQHQNDQQNYLTQLKYWVLRANAHLCYFWSQTVSILREYSVTIHLLSLFIVFFIVQTIHVYNVNRLKTDLKAFLIENEVLTKNDNDVDQLAQLMEYFGKEIKSLNNVKRTLRSKQS